MEPPLEPSSSSSSSSSSRDSGASASTSSRDVPAVKQKSALRRYVEGFDQAAMVETARIMSAEGAALVERQTSALLSDIKKLTKEIQVAGELEGSARACPHV